MPFNFVVQDEYNILTLNGEVNGGEKPTVEEAYVKHAATSPKRFLVVQCEDCGLITVNFLRQLAQVYRKLKENNGKLCLINVTKPAAEVITKNGLDRILPMKDSMRGALVEFGLAKTKEFDVNFINPFINATLKVLKIQCQLDATIQKPYAKKPTDPVLMGDISGIIGITSETFNGTLAISFPAKVFLGLASQMLGQPVTEIGGESVDLAGELSNIILGQAKIDLNALGYRIQQAIPSCVWGKDHQIKHFGAGICIVLPFETKLGIFHVEVMSNNTPAVPK